MENMEFDNIDSNDSERLYQMGKNYFDNGSETLAEKYLKEAAKRGYISKEDALWPGLLEMANCGAKSTAVKKAKELFEILGIG